MPKQYSDIHLMARAARLRARAGRPGCRRGMTSLLAMLYLVIFSAIALGFYTQTNAGRQISSNEQRLNEAHVAAESGVAFLKYHLSALNVAYKQPAQRLEEIYMQLAERLDGSASLGGGIIGYDGNAIYIPDGTHSYVRTHPGGPGFRARIKIKNDHSLQVKFVGRHSATTKGVGRGIEVTFKTEERVAPLFKYGMASRGQVIVSGEGEIRGVPDPAYATILVTTGTNPAVTMTGPSEISGDIHLSNASAFTSINSSCTVGGDTGALIPNHIKKVPLADVPEFPAIDTSIFIPYIKSTYTLASGSNVKNIRIPAGTGTSASPVKFASGATVDGIMYIESPNWVKFEGTATIRGVIVGPNTASGGLAANVIQFAGQATAHDISTLPPGPDFPDGLRALTGSSILANGFDVQFAGGYAAISGSIASSKLTFTGTAGGTITGHVLGLSNQVLSVSGKSQVLLQKPSTNKWPAGVFFRSRWVPNKDSYLEVPADDPPPPPASLPVIISPPILTS